MEALKQPHTFSNRRKPLGVGDPEFEAIAAQGYPQVATLSANEPPDHTRFRRLVNPFFAPRAVAGLEPRINSVVDAVIDSFIGKGECEYVSQFCHMVPSAVIADVLGEPRERIGDFIRWSAAIEANIAQNSNRERALEAKGEYVEFQQYFADRIAKRRADPGDDLVSKLARAALGGERQLEVAELLDLFRVILSGGNLTTMGLLGSGLLLLLKHPDQFEAVRNDFRLIPKMVEEVLRYESPDQWNPRTVASPGGAELGGVHIPEGARVLMVWGSANRDETVFKSPDDFNIFRADSSEHIAFGFGTHFCLGASLARTEARVAFERLFSRLTDIECLIPLDEVEYHPSPMDHGLERLPVRFRAV
jgi:cytochrome P450